MNIVPTDRELALFAKCNNMRVNIPSIGYMIRPRKGELLKLTIPRLAPGAQNGLVNSVDWKKVIKDNSDKD